MVYQSLNALSGSIFRTAIYYDEDVNYKIEYICDATPETALNDTVWRVRRVRYSKATSNVHDVTRPINPDAWVFNSGKWDAEFHFKATDLAYVSALSYYQA